MRFPKQQCASQNSSALPKTALTAAGYLAIERAAETKSEFFEGEMFAITGTTKNHARIVMNLSCELSARLKGRTCEPFATDLRVKVEANGLYTSPRPRGRLR